MGDVISFEERRRALAGAVTAPPRRSRFARTTFSFDLALAQTYLVAERVDQLFPGVRWQPASAEAFWGGAVPHARLAAEAAERAAALGEPLVWPDPRPEDVRPARRPATLACELGRGAAFVLAAGRLAYCGGFDLGDPEVLAEAAAAASVPLDLCLAAAGDPARDAVSEDAARRLRALGADELPALRVGRRLFCGEGRLPAAAAAAVIA
jgi:2-hydroxychromene-2-carboxylate isomerase